MPFLVTCKGSRTLRTEWNVGSDEFVVVSFLSVAGSLTSIFLVLVVLWALFAALTCTGAPAILYTSFILMLALEFAAAIVDGIILIISARGTIFSTHQRRHLIPFLYVRLTLLGVRPILLILSTIAVGNSGITSVLQRCRPYTRTLQLAQAVVVILWVLWLLRFIRWMLYIDPLGLFAPGVAFWDQVDAFVERTLNKESMSSSSVVTRSTGEKGRGGALIRQPTRLGRAFETNVEHVPSYWRWNRDIFDDHLRRRTTGRTIRRSYAALNQKFNYNNWLSSKLKALVCCLGVETNQLKEKSLQSTTNFLLAFFTVEGEAGRGLTGPDGESIYLTADDLRTGLILLGKKQEGKEDEKSLTQPMREMTLSKLQSQSPEQIPENYCYSAKREFDLSQPASLLLYDDLLHFLPFAMGVYGCLLHVFAHPLCGICQISAATWCTCNFFCCNAHARDHFDANDCCLCVPATIRLNGHITEEQIIHISDSNEVYQTPYCLLVDDKRGCIVVAVRGTLSPQDALTNISYSMDPLEVEGVKGGFIHQGVHRAARTIIEELEGKQLLERIFQQHPGYQLVLTGHSLGGGVASALAVLLRPQFPDLICYAFSPIGAMFSLSLAVYSRAFITSVVLDRDIVPRISLRSFLHLKHCVLDLLRRNKLPKFRILNPVYMDRLACTLGWSRHVDEGQNENETESRSTVIEMEALESSAAPDSEPRPPSADSEPRLPSGRLSGPTKGEIDSTARKAVDEAVELSTTEESLVFSPSYPPGRLLHLTAEEDHTSCSTMLCIQRPRMHLHEVSNEDWCAIDVGEGTFLSHLPNKLYQAMVLFREQHIGRKCRSDARDVSEMRARERESRRCAQERSPSSDSAAANPGMPVFTTLYVEPNAGDLFESKIN